MRWPDGLLAQVVPQPMAWAEEFGPGDESGLIDPEPEAVANAVPQRRREYATVRRCARSCMSTVGVPPQAVLRDAQGAPQWPRGYGGSMTHCSGYAGAVLTPVAEGSGIGIDAEPNIALPGDVLAQVSVAEERALVEYLRAKRADVAWDRLLFSVKESVYKAWYPVTGEWLDFTQARVRLGLEGTWQAWVRAASGSPVRIHGRWIVGAGLALSAGWHGPGWYGPGLTAD